MIYTWEAFDLESAVTWTLAPSDTGTVLRMMQTGFRDDQQQAYHGARHGWQRFLDALANLLGHSA